MTDDQIREGMLQWQSGSLSTATLDRLLVAVLQDIWIDSYRRGENSAAQARRFNERVQAGIRTVLG